MPDLPPLIGHLKWDVDNSKLLESIAAAKAASAESDNIQRKFTAAGAASDAEAASNATLARALGEVSKGESDVASQIARKSAAVEADKDLLTAYTGALRNGRTEADAFRIAQLANRDAAKAYDDALAVGRTSQFAAAAASVALNNAIKQQSASFSKARDDLSTATSGMVSGIRNLVGAVAQVPSGMRKFSDDFKQARQEAEQTEVRLTSLIATGIRPFVSAIGTAVTAVRDFRDHAVREMMEAADTVGRAIGTMAAVLVNTFVNLPETIGRALGTLAAVIVNTLVALPRMAVDAVTRLGEAIVEGVVNTARAAVDGAVRLGRAIYDGVVAIPHLAVEAVQALRRGIVDLGRAIVSGVVNAAKFAWNALNDLDRIIGTALVNGVKFASAAISGFAQELGLVAKAASDAAEKTDEMAVAVAEAGAETAVGGWKQLLTVIATIGPTVATVTAVVAALIPVVGTLGSVLYLVAGVAGAAAVELGVFAVAAAGAFATMALGFGGLFGLAGGMVLLAGATHKVDGPLNQVKQDLKDMADRLGTAVAPMVTQMLQLFDSWIPTIGNLGQEIVNWFGPRLGAVLNAANGFFQIFSVGLEKLGGVFGKFFDAVLQRTPQFQALFGKAMDVVVNAADGLLTNLVKLSDWFTKRLPADGPIVQQILGKIGDAIQWAAQKAGQLSDWITAHWPQIQKAAKDVQQAIQGIAPYVQQFLDDAVKLANYIIQNWPTIVQTAKDLKKAIHDLQPVFDLVIGVAKFLFDHMNQIVFIFNLVVFAADIVALSFKGMVNSINLVIDVVQQVITWFGKLKDAAGEKIGDLVSFMQDLPGRISDAVGDLGNLLWSAGWSVVQGLIDGIQSRYNDLASAASGLAGIISSYLPFSPAKLGPLSGSGAPEFSGMAISANLARGMLASSGQVRQAVSQIGTDVVQGLTGRGSGGLTAGVAAAGGALVARGGYQITININGAGDPSGVAAAVNSRLSRLLIST